MKKILIPVDGSEYSSHAIAKGRELADAFNSEVIILNVVPSNITTARRIHFDAHDTVDEFRAASENVLKKAKKQFGKYAGKIKTVSVDGDAAVAIVDYAEENGCDLIIMGTRGVGGLKGLLMGSQIQKVISLSDIPVLAVK